MKIRELLGMHYAINHRIDSKLEQITELRSLAAKVTASPFSESHSKGTYSDRVGRTTARIMDLENEINDDIDRLVDIKIRINELVTSLDDEIQRIIIERHYILNESWEKISEKVGYSRRHITRLHDKAIESLERIHGENIELCG
ncbi:MAG: hypothetical protein IKK53_05710 [Ruminiclostridium sp.]|nr:hypothetical protein [Ruminiclostridium sp.]